MENLDVTTWQNWIGRTTTARDTVTERLIDGLTATLESGRHFPRRHGQTPASLHWCLAPPIAPMSALGADGHPARGGFLPDIPLPRRMWAGGSLEILDGLLAGDSVERQSRIAKIDVKQGKTGPLCFVQVDHTITTPRGIAIREVQDLVFREAALPAAAPAAPAAPPKPQAAEARHFGHELRLHADPVLLFRYSALTFNGHRIHYDRSYAMQEEFYAGLVVHGPLQASLLLEFAANIKSGKTPRHFTYRALSPLFDGADFFLKASEDGGGGLTLWVEDSQGKATMKAQATW